MANQSQLHPALTVPAGSTCSDVLVTQESGEQEVQPAYTQEELDEITTRTLWWKRDKGE